MVRPPATPASILEDVSEQLQSTWQQRIVEVPRMDVSATEVRQRVKAGEQIDDLVPSEVARYIQEHGLYR
jgi:nicotinate-nucleotide adenylyltransferase